MNLPSVLLRACTEKARKLDTKSTLPNIMSLTVSHAPEQCARTCHISFWLLIRHKLWILRLILTISFKSGINLYRYFKKSVLAIICPIPFLILFNSQSQQLPVADELPSLIAWKGYPFNCYRFSNFCPHFSMLPAAFPLQLFHHKDRKDWSSLALLFPAHSYFAVTPAHSLQR